MKRIVSGSAFLIILLSADPSNAQELNYGDYEGLFGEPVTVNATGKPERVSDSAVPIDVITAEDIERSGARDIPTLLGRLAGIDVTHASPGTEDLGIGGYIQPLVSRVMVLINGRQVYFDGFGNEFWSTLPVELDEIRQIEVIRGPQSALYGFNAVDGVINIVTFDPVDDPLNSARARFGNHALREFSASATQSLGEGAGVRLTAADDHSHDYGMTDKTPDNLAYGKNPNRRMASFDAAATLADGSRLSLEGAHSDVSQRLLASNLFFDARIKSDSLRAAYAAETGLGRITASADYTDVELPWVQSQPIGPFHVSDRSATAQLADLFKLGSVDSFRLALDGRHDQMVAPPVISGPLTGDLGAGSAMWDHAFSPTLSMVNAVRYDYFKLGRSGVPAAYDIYTNADFDRSDQGTSVNSALIDRLTGRDTLRLTFARGLKLPSLANFGEIARFQPRYTGFYFYGNPDLLASAVYDYRAQWEHRFDDVGATAKATVYHDMTMSHISSPYALINGRPAEIATDSTGSVTNGLMLDIQHKVRDGWGWGGNYTYQRLHEHYDWGLRNASPVNKANLHLGYDWGEWEGDLYMNYVSATKGLLVTPGLPATSTVVAVPGHVSLSPRIGWRPTNSLTIELVGENLWPYHDVLAQEMEPSAYLSVRLSY